jgi:ribosomal protein L44E
MAEHCPTHPETELVTYCPACRGRSGGQVSSAKKRAASKISLDRARKYRWRKAREPE